MTAIATLKRHLRKTKKNVRTFVIGKFISLFLSQNVCCVGSFEHPKQTLKLIDIK